MTAGNPKYDMLQLATGVFSFFGGFLTYLAGAKLIYPKCICGVVYSYRMWRLTKDLDSALAMQDVSKYEHLHWALTVLKLYSPNVVDQLMTMSQMVATLDDRSVDVLVDRLVSKPDLSTEARSSLLACLRRIMRHGRAVAC